MLPWKEQHATLSLLLRSPCKYCSARQTHTHTHSGGVRCHADRKCTTELLNKWGKATPPSILGLSENSGPVSILSVRFLLLVKVSSAQDQKTQLHTFRSELMKSIYLNICTSWHWHWLLYRFRRRCRVKVWLFEWHKFVWREFDNCKKKKKKRLCKRSRRSKSSV